MNKPLNLDIHNIISFLGWRTLEINKDFIQLHDRKASQAHLNCNKTHSGVSMEKYYDVL